MIEVLDRGTGLDKPVFFNGVEVGTIYFSLIAKKWAYLETKPVWMNFNQCDRDAVSEYAKGPVIILNVIERMTS